MMGDFGRGEEQQLDEDEVWEDDYFDDAEMRLAQVSTGVEYWRVNWKMEIK